MKRLVESGAEVFLVNTGWTGGAHGQGGERFAIPTTRRVIDAILSGELKQTKYELLPGFNLSIPCHIAGLDNKQLDPRLAWQSTEAYTQHQQELIAKFQDNFQRFQIESAIVDAGPKLGELL